MRISKYNKIVLGSYMLIYSAMCNSGEMHEKYSPASIEFWYCALMCAGIYIYIIVGLVIFSGFCSGAT